jgi:trimeric autotransporter adhesin
MKPKPLSFICPFLGRQRATAMALITLALSHPAFADTKSWNALGTSVTWTTAGNWTGGVPANDLTTDIALFNQTSYAFQPTASNSRQLGGIIIGDGSTATAELLISTSAAGGRLALGANGIDMKAASGAVTIGQLAPRGILLGASQTWNNDSSSLLTVTSVGNFNTLTASTYTLTLTGSGSGGITLGGGVVSDSGTVSTGVTALTINRSGTGAVLLGTANTYSGGTTVTAGLLQIGVGNVGSVGAVTSSAIGTGALALNGGTISSNSTTARTILNAHTIGGNVTLGDATNNGALTFSANTDLGGGTRTLTTASNVSLDGIVSNGGLTKAGSGVLTFNGANTYSSGTTLNDGIIRISVGNVGTLGAITSSAVGTGTLTLNGGTLTASSNAARVILNANTIGGNVTLGDATLTGALTFNANTDLGGATRTLTVASAVTLDGTLSNGGIIKEGSAMLNLSGNNSTFSGPITLNGGSIRILGTPTTRSLGTGTVTLTSGTLFFQPNNSTNYGNSVVVNGNSTISNSTTVLPKTMTLGSLSVGANTLTVETGASVPTSSLAAGVAFGAATLTGASQFVVNNQVGGAVSTLFTLASMDNGGFTPQFSGDGNITVTGAITGSGGLTLASTGTTTLSGTSSYGGLTTVSAGRLLINGNNSAAAGAVTISDSATLGGGGVIGGALTLSSGGTLAPGVTAIPAVATLTANAGATIAGSYNCDVDGAVADKLSVTGAITLSGPLTVNLLAGGFTQPSYVIAEGTSLSGTFSSVTSGYSVTYTATQAILTSTGGNAFDNWIASFTPNALLPDAASKLPESDPDGDGINNLLEFTLGGSPVVSSQAILPTQAIVGENLVLSYKRSDESESPVTTQIGQWSTDLITWTDVTPVLVNEHAAALDDMTVTVPTSNAVAGKLFLRLQVVK